MSREETKAGRAAVLLDALVEGRPAEGESADERALLEAAQLLREEGRQLAPARRDALVAEAFAMAVTPRAGVPRPRRRAALAYAVAATSLAAAVAVWLGTRPQPAVARLRSPDAVVGRIAPAEAGDASRRIDLLYADRLAAYRRGTP